MPTCRLKVQAGLKASSSEIQEICTLNAAQALGFSYIVRRSMELDGPLKEALWLLLDRNMRVLSESSSMGWNVKKKRLELFHRFSRFIFVFQGSKNIASELVAFSMFRFEHEDGESLLYCYELQVAEEVRGMGIGSQLTVLLEQIAWKWEMEKVMLTVLKANKQATKFYTKAGFSMDAMSPCDGVDYEILSKDIFEEDEEFDAVL